MAKEYSVMADFSIVPISHGETSVSRYVAEAINAAKKMRETRSKNQEFKREKMKE